MEFKMKEYKKMVSKKEDDLTEDTSTKNWFLFFILAFIATTLYLWIFIEVNGIYNYIQTPENFAGSKDLFEFILGTAAAIASAIVAIVIAAAAYKNSTEGLETSKASLKTTIEMERLMDSQKRREIASEVKEMIQKTRDINSQIIQSFQNLQYNIYEYIVEKKTKDAMEKNAAELIKGMAALDSDLFSSACYRNALKGTVVNSNGIIDDYLLMVPMAFRMRMDALEITNKDGYFKSNLHQNYYIDHKDLNGLYCQIEKFSSYINNVIAAISSPLYASGLNNLHNSDIEKHEKIIKLVGIGYLVGPLKVEKCATYLTGAVTITEFMQYLPTTKDMKEVLMKMYPEEDIAIVNEVVTSIVGDTDNHIKKLKDEFKELSALVEENFDTFFILNECLLPEEIEKLEALKKKDDLTEILKEWKSVETPVDPKNPKNTVYYQLELQGLLKTKSK
jgi:hypothetical protein